MLPLGSKRHLPAPKQAAAGTPKRQTSEGDAPVVKKLTKTARAKSAGRTRRRTRLAVRDAEEQILREATKHLIRKHGGLFVATGIREEPGAAPPRLDHHGDPALPDRGRRVRRLPPRSHLHVPDRAVADR